jgi:ATP synthase protein I
MPEMPDNGRGTREVFTRNVGDKETRKIRARQSRSQGIWFGLGTFGVVGWSVAVPTVLGVLLGAWIDSQWPGQASWTLMLLLLGALVGCLNAWYWISRERQIIERQDKKADDDLDR